VLKKLKDIGLDVGSDLMYFDDDIFYPFITDIQNVERGWLVRYYDNNYFVRNIVIKSKISLKTTRPWFTEKISVYQKLSDLGFSEYIVALPGPLTIANYSIDEARVYASKSQIMIDYARIIAEIAESYINNGIRVELHEPELCFTSQLTNELIRQIYVDLFSPLGEKVHLVTYFGVPNLEILNLLPRDLTLGVEAISLEKSREIFDKLKDFSSIRLGIVDSRNTKMEKIDDLISLVFKLEDKGIHIEYLSFNSMTEFLPEVIAYKKVKLLKRVVEAIKH
jgi:5-methyltetrahydropteroyltriglutamate--homocysteine methyltransferase